MYAFHELCNETGYSFCYLLGVLKKVPKESDLRPDFFTDEFEWLLNVEEQSDTVRQTQKRCPLIKRYILPSAPLTMAPAWTPFPIAFSVLPRCVQHKRLEGEFHNSAFAIWHPELASVGENNLMDDTGKVLASFNRRITASDIEFENIHARHFFWLLQMTVERAKKMRRHVVLAGTPGFSYANSVKHDEPPHSRIRLLESGYLYPSRVPHVGPASTTNQ
ncbi:hypothetical protein [Verrucomicrobium sp. BvORR034]|uniref:hypothetical protein n=1 Tax=Verrucomicrobium sp. BvORR034 TaxID=1396418 RepID=UPI000678CB02|nr:hypothetical protein [Verrucomicrobium sp. BvORR034]